MGGQYSILYALVEPLEVGKNALRRRCIAASPLYQELILLLPTICTSKPSFQYRFERLVNTSNLVQYLISRLTRRIVRSGGLRGDKLESNVFGNEGTGSAVGAL